MVHRRCLNVVLLSALVAQGCAPATSPASLERPNVILIVVDTLRADHLEDYGYHLPTDVGLDALRQRATRFERCSSPAPWTGPSVASLVTGLFTARHGTNAPGARLPDDAFTLAELLKQEGWSTAGISFNHVISEESGHSQGFDLWDSHLGETLEYPDLAELFERAEAWLDQEREGPFFLYLQPMNCHGPYLTPEDHLTGLLDRRPAAGFEYYGDAMSRTLKQADNSGVTAPMITSLVEQYDTAIRYTTDQVGLFLSRLEERGLFDDTLVILTSDHGEELYDHGGFSHGYSLYDEVLHVPLYIKLPGQLESRTVAEAVSLVDLYPTVAELLNLGTEHDLDGRSLTGYLRGDAWPEGLSISIYQTSWTRRCVGLAIVSEGHKLVRIGRDWTSPEPRTLLFDLEQDPSESRNLAAAKPELVERLDEQLKRRFHRYKSMQLSAPSNALEQMDQERLRALGYAE